MTSIHYYFLLEAHATRQVLLERGILQAVPKASLESPMQLLQRCDGLTTIFDLASLRTNRASVGDYGTGVPRSALSCGNFELTPAYRAAFESLSASLDEYRIPHAITTSANGEERVWYQNGLVVPSIAAGPNRSSTRGVQGARLSTRPPSQGSVFAPKLQSSRPLLKVTYYHGQSAPVAKIDREHSIASARRSY